MMHGRTELTKRLLKDDGVYFHHIDENEHLNASSVLSLVFGERNRVADIVWKNSSKNGEKYVSMQHEYVIGAVNDANVNKGNWQERKEGLEQIYNAFDGFKKAFAQDWKAIHKAALEFYNSFPESNLIRDSSHYSWMDDRGVYFPDNISKPANGYFYDVIHPVTGLSCKKPAGGWRFIETTMNEKIARDEIHFGDDHTTVPNNKTYLKNTESQSLTSIKYRDGRVASNLLKDMFGEKDPFKNPKDVELTSRILKALEIEQSIVLDYFAGSGTTVHASIEIAREGGKHKYICVEVSESFDTVLVPRIRKAAFSRNWKDGKATNPSDGVSQGLKILKLESYEDTLNNLELRRAEAQVGLLDKMTASAKDEYLQSYMLDVESRGSLLSVESFKKPFDFKLKVAVDSAGASEVRNVDLVETFNYLIGLTVKTIDADMERGFVTVVGRLPSGERTLVLWRDCEKIGYEELTKLCDKLAVNPADTEYDVVYVNGDHNIPSVLTSTEDEGGITRSLKLRQIEPEFLSAMFDVEDV